MKKHKAVFTIVKNEKVMLPIWLRYYSQHFTHADMFVLDHQTTDGSTQDLPCKRRPIASDYAFDHAWLNRVVRNYQMELLQHYKYVLFVEADEFVFHKDGLGNYIDAFTGVSVACNGFELQHLRGHEMDIDLSRPILDQRSFWYPNYEYCKTLLSSVPIHWDLGFHLCANPGILDPDLYLVHLHRFDYGIALKKNEDRAKLKWNKLDVARRHGFQNRIVGEEFDLWFEAFRAKNVIQPIPDEVKNSHAF
jgi:hypothetical protein